MSTEHRQDSVTPNDESTLPEERSVGGIFVHFLAVPTGIASAGIVYLLATNEFTKQNARHAINWHLTMFVVWGPSVLLFVFEPDSVRYEVANKAIQLSVSRRLLETLLTTVGMLLLTVILLTVVYGIVAMLKATERSARPYPAGLDIIKGVKHEH